MKIALAHDFLAEYGGAERVLEAMHEIWPEAPVYTAFYSKKGMGKHWQKFKDYKLKTSWAQRVPFMSKLYSPLRLWAKNMFESFEVSDYDLVISSTNMYMAKAIGKKDKKKPFQICYCHTPPRPLYGYPTARNWQRFWLGKAVGSLINFWMRKQDFEAQKRVDVFVANSKETQKRIKKFYKREAKVIYPPASRLRRTGPPAEIKKGDYYLVVSRLSYAKRVDLAVEACNRLKLKLKVVGKGRDEESLKKMAGKTVEFLGEVSDQRLRELYAGCKAFIFPALEEDFGIVAVEAMSFGKPVLALRSGGVEESVVAGETGYFFEKPKVESLAGLLKDFENGKLKKIKTENCIKRARKFSKANFKRELKELAVEQMRGKSEGV